MDESSFTNVNASHVTGRSLYLAVSNRIITYDISEPAKPLLVSETPTRGAPYLLAGSGNYLWSMEVFYEGEELAVFAADGGTLREAVRIHLADFRSGFPRALLVDAQSLVVADVYQGVYTIDVTDAMKPSVRKPSPCPGVQSLCRSADIIFAGSDHGVLSSFKRSSADWTGLQSMTLVDGCIHDIAVSGTTVCAAFGRYGSHGYSGFSGFAVIESDGTSMRERSRVPLERNAMGVHMRGGVAYFLLQEWGHEWYDTASGVHAYDVTKEAPELIGSFEMTGKFEQWSIVWPYAYVADRMFGVRVIDLSDPSSPREIAALPVTGTAGGKK